MKKLAVKLILVILIAELVLRVTGSCYYFIQTFHFVKKSENKIKILCLGESTTFGLGAQKGFDYPSQLGMLLEDKFPGRFIVYNRGIPGATSLKILQEMRRFMKNIKPDFVIMLCGVNDFNPACNLLPGNNGKSPRSFLSFARRAWRQLEICRVPIALKDLFVYEMTHTCGTHPKARPSEEFEETQKRLITRQYNDNIKAMTRLTRSHGAEIIFSTYLWPWIQYELIKDAAQRNQARLCDQVKMLKESGLPVSAVMSVDGFHPNAAGYKFMAESLLSTLEGMPSLSEGLNASAKLYKENVNSVSVKEALPR